MKPPYDYLLILVLLAGLGGAWVFASGHEAKVTQQELSQKYLGQAPSDDVAVRQRYEALQHLSAGDIIKTNDDQLLMMADAGIHTLLIEKGVPSIRVVRSLGTEAELLHVLPIAIETTRIYRTTDADWLTTFRDYTADASTHPMN